MKVPDGTSTSVRPSLRLYLGSAAKFMVLAGTTVIFGSPLTVLASGSVGTSSGGDITGKYLLQAGTAQIGTTAATNGMNDYLILNGAASGALCTSSLTLGSLSGVTLTPGVYCYGSSALTLGAWKSLTLDAQGVSTSLWVLKSTGSLVTGDHSSMILQNGALSSNVFWSVGTTATLGASSFFVGQILALTEIVVGSQSVLNGRGFTKTSVTFNGGSLVSLSAQYSNSNVTMGSSSKNFAVLAGTSVLFGSRETVISSGSVGVSPGSVITGNYTLKSGTPEPATTSAASAAGDMAIMYNSGSTLVCQNYMTNGDLSGVSLTPGVYCSSSGKFSVGQMRSVVLDARNVSGVSWVFQMTGNMTMEPESVVILKNGASASNVYWIVGGAANMGYGSSVMGTILAQSSISFGPYAIVDGRSLSMSGVSFGGGSSVKVPYGFVVTSPATLLLYYGMASKFAILALIIAISVVAVPIWLESRGAKVEEE